jgi:hypothetical protein
MDVNLNNGDRIRLILRKKPTDFRADAIMTPLLPLWWCTQLCDKNGKDRWVGYHQGFGRGIPGSDRRLFRAHAATEPSSARTCSLYRHKGKVPAPFYRFG